MPNRIPNVARVRRELELGVYETDPKLELAVDRVLAELNREPATGPRVEARAAEQKIWNALIDRYDMRDPNDQEGWR